MHGHVRSVQMSLMKLTTRTASCGSHVSERPLPGTVRIPAGEQALKLQILEALSRVVYDRGIGIRLLLTHRLAAMTTTAMPELRLLLRR